MHKCPNCNQTLRAAGSKEYILLDPTDPTKGTIKTDMNMVCINPLCTLFGGSTDDATVTVEFPYQKGDKTVVEAESRPKVDFSNLKKIAKVLPMPDKVVEVRTE
jgi:hypothetical protein